MVVDVDSTTWDREVLQASVPVIVDFWAPWCPWCKRLMPDFESLATEYVGRLAFVKVNVEQAPELAPRYGVKGLPTLKFFCGGRPLAEIVGYLPKTSLKAQLETMLSNHKDCLAQSSIMKSS
jgi:thioredoxin 1